MSVKGPPLGSIHVGILGSSAFNGQDIRLGRVPASGDAVMRGLLYEAGTGAVDTREEMVLAKGSGDEWNVVVPLGEV